jgi:hypothetical protein
MTFFEFSRQLTEARLINGTNDIFGVEYYSATNKASRNYTMFKTEQEFQSWSDSLKDWDFIINRLAI